MAEGFENIALYEPTYSCPYGAPLLNDVAFKTLWTLMKKAAVFILYYVDSSRREEYNKYFEETKKYFERGSPIMMGFIPMFAGINPLVLPKDVYLPYIMQFAMKLMASVRMVKEIEMTPEISTIELKKPLFIIGLPRSGTTFLHHLLACGENARTVALYQQFFPGDKTMDEKHRKQFCGTIVDFLNENSDDLETTHGFKVNEPEEDYFVMEMLGCSFAQACAIPRYEEYRKQIFKRDWQYIYDILRDVLKIDILENKISEDQYLCLKNVQHICFMKNLLQTFPDGQFVWVHRDPFTNFKSCLHLYKQAQLQCPKDVGMNDKEWLNNSVLYMTKLALQNAIAARDSWVNEKPERASQFYDVSFKKFTKNPFDAIKDIHQHFGLPFGEKTKENLEKELKSDPKKAHGSSTLEDGLMTVTEKQVRDELKFYNERFPTMF
ncbi:hypothetical protein EIN_060100 [Entamoeba invadens IP1]|uniref:hypothetical protein n=1 Tax=Entamoeba invadens IP1 TaxID=370355 RepID=UPI0002C3D4E8|nr:hypothetical protein EIN_060100 [Entamoeba invadens IP1]ELP93495.1 hypothetical protein EIN_060100 [Entamoeba invadens IP1]|eukprot:XP_004260266.1 hypothetical protein EIN_060100 [Entamoeba invadens IP1]